MSLQTENRIYWNHRAPSYTEVVQKNLAGGWDEIWADMLISRFPKRESPKVLDIGTGPGFYALILASRGYSVTAVDFSPEMLSEAKRNAGALADEITFLQMDAQSLSFPEGSFDVIVTRNLTWNLPDPEKAYREWYRVLSDGGVLLNFDANWYSYLFDPAKAAEFASDRENVRAAGMEDHEAYTDADQMENISRKLPMSRVQRPEWDLDRLQKIGFSMVSADMTIGEKVWNPEEKLNYRSTPGFLIKAVK